MKKSKSVSIETALAQGLGRMDDQFKGVIPGIHPSTTYEREPDGSYPNGRVYTRDQNPNYDQAESMLSLMEKGEGALLFSSGMSAAVSIFQALLPGDHIVAPKVMYWALRNWLLTFGADMELKVDFVENGDIDAVKAAAKPGQTKIMWMETPANPTWAVDDIAAWAEIAKSVGARLAVDNTVATPILTQPISLGADIVMHSATKYLNGHSDVLAGALITKTKDAFWERIAKVRNGGGAVMGPMEAWLLTRGMRTLSIRVERASSNAMKIAEALQSFDNVESVQYPGLPTDPGYEISCRQMNGGFGGMLSVCIKGGAEDALAVTGRLELFKRATSLGGVESLVEHRASIEGEGTPCPQNLLRLSIGIESADDLIADLKNAIDC
ncbi:MAG: PLP-dependent transferase [Sneathiella sp.]|nr:PLP-dependent transferase [Sneathiella sp.]